MKHFSNQKGLTLLETIVALVLVLLLVTAFAGAMTAGLQREVEVDNSLRAADLAASIIEYLGESDDREIVKNIYEATGEISLSNFKEDEDTDFTIEEELRFTGFDPEGSKINVETFNDQDYLYIITVIIEWQESGTTRSNELISLLMVEPDDDEED